MSSPPTPYDRQANFTDWSSTHPGQQQPGVDLDKEFDAIRTALNKEISRLLEIQRSDGKLKNQIVTRDSLAADVPLGFGAPTPWASGQAYTANLSTVFYDAKFWLCITTHVSGATFAGDAAKWSLIADLGSGATDAAASAVEAAASAADAQAAQTAAEAAQASAEAAAAAAAAFDSSLYLTKADNLNSVDDKPTARTNLGLRIGTTKVWVGGADPGGAAQDGDIWIP